MNEEKKKLISDIRREIQKARNHELKAQKSLRNVFSSLEKLSIDEYDGVPDTEAINNDNFIEYIEGYIDNGEDELNNIIKSILKKAEERENERNKRL